MNAIKNNIEERMVELREMFTNQKRSETTIRRMAVLDLLSELNVLIDTSQRMAKEYFRMNHEHGGIYRMKYEMRMKVIARLQLRYRKTVEYFNTIA